MLDTSTLAPIRAATGLSLAACSQIGSGTRVPHPRHWEALIAIMKGEEAANSDLAWQ